MFDRLMALFVERDGAAEGARAAADELQVAAAALLVVAATVDDSFDETERAVIVDALTQHFRLAPVEVESLLEQAERRAGESNQLYGFTRVIKDRLSYDERLRLMEMLWEVILADGRIDDLEASLMRRVAGLIFVDDRDSGLARQRAQAKLEERAAP